MRHIILHLEPKIQLSLVRIYIDYMVNNTSTLLIAFKIGEIVHYNQIDHTPS